MLQLSEAKSLANLARKAEGHDQLLEARQQYLASEEVLFSKDAEKGLQRVAEATERQVRKLMSEAAQAYAARKFELTALLLLNQCVGAMQDQEVRRQLAELYTALATGEKPGTVALAMRGKLQQLNAAILQSGDKGASYDDSDADAPATPQPGLCARMTALQSKLPGNAALLFNLAKCAELEGRVDETIMLLTKYTQRAPMAADNDEVQLRLAVLRALSALPDPAGAQVRALYATAARHVEARRYDQAVAAYLQADELMPAFATSKRRVATLLLAQGQVERARTVWLPVLLADTNDDSRKQTQLIVDGLDAEQARYQELVGDARGRLQKLLGRSFLDGQQVGRIYAASQLQLANEKIQSALLLFPIAAEVNALQAFNCLQMNDFRCVRASFDAQRSLAQPVSFYATVAYKSANAGGRTYGKLEFETDTLRFVEVSSAKRGKRTVDVAGATAGEDRLGRLGAVDGLRSAEFQGFTVPTSAIRRFGTKDGVLLLELEDRKVERRKIGLSQRQVQRLAMEQQLAIHGMAFKVIPGEPTSMAFRKELR